MSQPAAAPVAPVAPVEPAAPVAADAQSAPLPPPHPDTLVVDAPISTTPAPPPAPPKRRRRIGWIIAVTLLSLALIATGIVLALTLVRLDEARSVINKQNDIIDKKETFSSAMKDLVKKTGAFDGVLFGTLVPDDKVSLLAVRGYKDRWDPAAMTQATADVRATTSDLDAQLAAAATQAATNASGSTYESTIDSLGSGWVTTAIDGADALCGQDVLGCVTSDDPYTIHIDAADTTLPYMTDFIRTGISYHEFAHVLQYTNVAATDPAVAAFGGDFETMADCFALTYLPGWALHQTVWINDYEYYEVDLGYGYTCNADQAQVVRDWYEGLGYTSPSVTE